MGVQTPAPKKANPAAKGSKPFNPSGDELENIVAGQAKADSVARAPKSPKPARKVRY